MGEPIDREAWTWYYEKVGHSKCAVVDTYWQTETGSIVITPLPGATPTKPGSATYPFFGILPAILDPITGQELEGDDVTGILAIKKPWPSMARTIFNNHHKYMETYLRPYPGYYFTGKLFSSDQYILSTNLSMYYVGDGATRDKDQNIWIRGRVDGKNVIPLLLSHF